MARKFERRHYVAIAEVVKNLDVFDANYNDDGGYVPAVAIGDLIEDLCRMFAADGGNFKRERFIKAATKE